MKHYSLFIFVLTIFFFNESARCAEKKELLDHPVNVSITGKSFLTGCSGPKNLVPCDTLSKSDSVPFTRVKDY